jgi:hypothetical protein
MSSTAGLTKQLAKQRLPSDRSPVRSGDGATKVLVMARLASSRNGVCCFLLNLERLPCKVKAGEQSERPRESPNIFGEQRQRPSAQS